MAGRGSVSVEARRDETDLSVPVRGGERQERVELPGDVAQALVQAGPQRHLFRIGKDRIEALLRIVHRDARRPSVTGQQRVFGIEQPRGNDRTGLGGEKVFFREQHHAMLIELARDHQGRVQCGNGGLNITQQACLGGPKPTQIVQRGVA